jgi:16S rRNA (cytidine1402-2'-O)-methyltransferase
VDRLVGMLKLGFNITLVADAGTPTISDPGYLLVNKCIQSGVEIFSLPGPSCICLYLTLNKQ